MNLHVSDLDLYRDNLAYAGTGGVSKHATCARFLPAFKDLNTGRVEIARKMDGAPAPCHLICALPAEWAKECDDEGRVCAVRSGIIAGFVRDQVFYTREQAAHLVA